MEQRDLKELTAEKAQKKAGKLLAKSNVVYLGTNGSHGHPNVRAMSVAKADGLKHIWFITSLAANKLIELIKDPKSVVYATVGPECDGKGESFAELRLWGSIEILDDRETREATWSDAYRAYFSAGANDPNLRVLKFTAIAGGFSDEKGYGVFDI